MQNYENVFVMDHPLIQHKLTFLRDVSTGTKNFRELVSEIATLMCYEATRDLPLMDVETVIIAIGQSPNPLIRHTTPGLDCQKWGGIIVNEETMESSKENVYAGGDTVTGAATVILAMGAGKKAAAAIDAKLSAK